MIGSKKLATGLKKEIADAAHCLNIIHYGLYIADQNNFPQGKNPNQALRKYWRLTRTKRPIEI